ncbi:hypothetical protein [Parachitinimonas caeni]|uniref:Uncharacterized protein n=1 Tax=Parachitinimonas caeni TaxID=3031301 RepID=A0ABT7E4J3_9NEIS|nr:hypothetical protein [Parachitinimonas caeni]MDK2126278.1 hypothetical protein [Parachitinimonas caeni]
MSTQDETRWAKWLRDDGSVVSCVEKVKVMNENLDEISQMLQDAFEDGLLMEVNETQLRQVMQQMVEKLVNPWPKGKA